MPDNCSDILKNGIYDYQKTVEDRTYSFVNWYRNNEIKTYQQAKNSTFNATVPVDDVLVGLGFSKSEQDFQKFQKLIETYTSTHESFKLDNSLQTINDKVVQAWSTCINKPGVHIWIEHTENPFEFVLCANYIDNGPLNEPKIRNIDIGAGNVKNNDGVFRNANGRINNQTILRGNTIKQIFIRNNSQPFTLVVNLTQGDALNYSFKKVPDQVQAVSIEKLPPIAGDPTTQKYGPYQNDVFIDFKVYQTATKTGAEAQMKISAIDTDTHEVISSGETRDIKPELDFGLEFLLRLTKGQARKITFEGWVNGCTKKTFRISATKTEMRTN